MLINITNFSPLSLFLLMILWVLRSRNAYEYHQLFSSLSLLPDCFISLAGATMLINITSYSPLSLFFLMVLWVLRSHNAYEYHQFFSSLSLLSDGFISLASVEMLINITSSSLLSLFFLMVLWVLRSRNAYK